MILVRPPLPILNRHDPFKGDEITVAHGYDRGFSDFLHVAGIVGCHRMAPKCLYCPRYFCLGAAVSSHP